MADELKRQRTVSRAPLVRQRSHRIDRTFANKLLDALEHANSETCYGSMIECWASTLAAALSSNAHPVLRLLDDVSVAGVYSAQQVLAARANTCLNRGEESPPLQQWGDSSEWSDRFRRDMQHRLDDVRKVAGKRARRRGGGGRGA